jgi:hypothetical protein
MNNIEYSTLFVIFLDDWWRIYRHLAILQVFYIDLILFTSDSISKITKIFTFSQNPQNKPF